MRQIGRFDFLAVDQQNPATRFRALESAHDSDDSQFQSIANAGRAERRG